MTHNEDDKFVRVAPDMIVGENGHKPYELVIEDFVEQLNPPASLSIQPINPKEYFITSGDAVKKAAQLHKDLYAYSCRVRTAVKRKPTKELNQFKEKCWRVTGGAYSMKRALERARGDAVHIETEWAYGRVMCTPKNPRPRHQPDQTSIG